MAAYEGAELVMAKHLPPDKKRSASEIEARAIQIRVGGIAALASQAGAAFTFWKMATEAIKALGAENVDWADVEDRTIAESVYKNGQRAIDVGSVLCKYSPGAVSVARQGEIRQLLGWTPELESRYTKIMNEVSNAKGLEGVNSGPER